MSDELTRLAVKAKTSRASLHLLQLESLAIVTPVARRFSSASWEDILQEFALTFANYVRRFDSTKPMSWKGYITIRMKWFCMDFMRMQANLPTCQYTNRTGRRQLKAQSIHQPQVINGHVQEQDCSALLESHYRNHHEELQSFNDLVQPLSRRDRQIFVLYYVHGLTMSEIGSQLGLCESRISQIHSEELARLKRIAR